MLCASACSYAPRHSRVAVDTRGVQLKQLFGESEREAPTLPDALAMFRSLEHVDDTSYLLSQDLRIVRVNAAWARFAEANGGHDMLAHWGRGAFVLDAIAGELRAFYRDLFEGVLATGERREHDYECSSDRVERLFRMVVFPVAAPFLVITHSLRVERAHDRPEAAADEAAYRRDGIISMCSSCRRVQSLGAAERWNWVPSWVVSMPHDVSHGLCPPCAQVFLVQV